DRRADRRRDRRGLGRSPGRPGLARAAAVALALLLAAPSIAHAAGWGRPFRLAPPASLDVIPPQIAFAPSGAATVGYGIQDEDSPANSIAFEAGRSARGKLSAPRKIGGAQQILSLGYNGRTAELLTGASPRGLSCCSSVQVR